MNIQTIQSRILRTYKTKKLTYTSVVPADASVILEVAVEVGFRVQVRRTPVAMLNDLFRRLSG